MQMHDQLPTLPMLAFRMEGAEGNHIALTIDEVFDFPHETSYGGGYGAKGVVSVQSEGFTAKGELYFTTGELYGFLQELTRCHALLFAGKITTNFADSCTSAKIRNTEGTFEAAFTFDKTGKISVTGTYQQYSHLQNTLAFEFKSDQTQSTKAIQQLEQVVAVFGGNGGIMRKNRHGFFVKMQMFVFKHLVSKKLKSRSNMQQILIATGNAHKRAELARILAPLGFAVVTADALGLTLPEVDETEDTFVGNARLKARSGAAVSGLPCVADDSGLCVDALDGAPGVYSARFAGEHGNDAANTALLLQHMAAVPDAQRGAHFACAAVCVFPDGRELVAEGRCAGHIARAAAGHNGFGYDPVFLPQAQNGRSMAQLSAAEKDAISHRGQALAQLAALLSGNVVLNVE